MSLNFSTFIEPGDNAYRFDRECIDIDFNKEFNIKKLDKNIYVYKNVFKNPKRMVEILKNAENDSDKTFWLKNWAQWSIFGTYVQWNGKDVPLDEISQNDPLYTEELLMLNEIVASFYETTDHFLKDHNLSVKDNWKVMGPSLCRYDHDHDHSMGDTNQLAMAYHTDYKYLEADAEGYQFVLTFTAYLNDDYEGGELVLVLPNKEIIKYKPEAGDIVIFPSGHPDLLGEDGIYFHAVNRIKDKDRYMIRCFYQKYFEGTEEWHKNKELYGEEQWEKMERDRVIELEKKETNLGFILGENK